MLGDIVTTALLVVLGPAVVFALVRPAAAARPVVSVLRGYQRWISPVLPPSCRFHPSCSAYAIEAVGTHGAPRGVWLTARRLVRCGPWHPGGVDPVPPATAGAPRTAANHEEQPRC